MKLVVFLFVFVAMALGSFASDIHFQLAAPNFNASPASNRVCTLQPMTPFVGNLLWFTSSVSGDFTYSNAQVGLYNGYVKAPPGLIPFQIYVTATNLGTVEASSITASGTASVTPAGSVAWSIQASDGRYQLSSNSIGNVFYPLFSNPSNYAQLSQVTNIAYSIAVTSGVPLTTVTNVANYVYTNNANNYATRSQVSDTNTANLVITTNLVTAERNAMIATNVQTLAALAATNVNIHNDIATTNTANLVITTNLVSAATNGLAASILSTSNVLQQAKQPASTTLTNLSNTGAFTNAISAGQNLTLVTNAITITWNATNQTFLTNGLLLAANIVATNIGAAERAALQATQLVNLGFFYPTSNPSGFLTSGSTNGIVTQASLSASLVASNYATQSQVRDTNITALNAATNLSVAERAALVATNVLIHNDISQTNAALLGSIATSNTANLVITTNLVASERAAMIATNVQTLNALSATNSALNAVIIASNTANLAITTNLVISQGSSNTNDAAWRANSLTNFINYVNAKIGANTNFLIVSGAGSGTANGTNVWNNFGGWTNLNAGAFVTNDSSGARIYVGGISAYGSSYVVGNPWTNISATIPPTTAFFSKTNVASTGITITRDYGQDIFSSSGGAGATNAGGVLSGFITNAIFSAQGTNAILGMIPASGGATNATLNKYTTNTTPNVDAYVTNNVADQIGAASGGDATITNSTRYKLALTNLTVSTLNGLTNLVALGNNSFTLTIGNTNSSSGGSSTNAIVYTFYPTNTQAGTLVTNVISSTSVIVGFGTNLTSYINATNGVGNATTIVAGKTLTSTNVAVWNDTSLNGSNLHIYTNITGLLPSVTVSNAGLAFANGTYYQQFPYPVSYGYAGYSNVVFTNFSSTIIIQLYRNSVISPSPNDFSYLVTSNDVAGIRGYYYNTNGVIALPTDGTTVLAVTNLGAAYGVLPNPTLVFSNFLSVTNANVINSYIYPLNIIATNGLFVTGNIDTTVGYSINGLPFSGGGGGIPSTAQILVSGGTGRATNFNGIYSLSIPSSNTNSTIGNLIWTNGIAGYYLFQVQSGAYQSYLCTNAFFTNATSSPYPLIGTAYYNALGTYGRYAYDPLNGTLFTYQTNIIAADNPIYSGASNLTFFSTWFTGGSIWSNGTANFQVPVTITNANNIIVASNINTLTLNVSGNSYFGDTAHAYGGYLAQPTNGHIAYASWPEPAIGSQYSIIGYDYDDTTPIWYVKTNGDASFIFVTASNFIGTADGLTNSAAGSLSSKNTNSLASLKQVMSILTGGNYIYNTETGVTLSGTFAGTFNGSGTITNSFTANQSQQATNATATGTAMTTNDNRTISLTSTGNKFLGTFNGSGTVTNAVSTTDATGTGTATATNHSGVVSFSNAGNKFTGAFTGDGSAISNAALSSILNTNAQNINFLVDSNTTSSTATLTNNILSSGTTRDIYKTAVGGQTNSQVYIPNGVASTATNRLTFSSVSSFTNTLGRDATASLSAGTTVILKNQYGDTVDTVGTVATLHVLIPLSAGWQISGTAVSAIVY